MNINGLMNATGVLKKVFDTPMKAKDAYRCMRIQKKIDSELKNIEEVRIKTLKKYVELEDGEFKIKDGNVIFKENGLKEFEKEYSEFIKTKVKIDWKIPFGVLPELSVNEMVLIEEFVEPEGK